MQDPRSFFQQSKPGGIFLKEVSASIQHKEEKKKKPGILSLLDRNVTDNYILLQ